MKSSCDRWIEELDQLRVIEREVLDYFCENNNNNSEDQLSTTKSWRLEVILKSVDSIVEKVELSIRVSRKFTNPRVQINSFLQKICRFWLFLGKFREQKLANNRGYKFLSTLNRDAIF